eukprot:CAMPEP_0181085120 /NCGR_PEP_ID=MMETSP1071-20121207/5064_1 /TAXON_ID=35127 /ORGANISM="Thalassiosira sp., Strain NH16" /LENGTH=139 /DNA_ID=CAMNT_0023166909 /DNA_START=717 /DNA_END=1133 /DNA_ORIENTATION=+
MNLVTAAHVLHATSLSAALADVTCTLGSNCGGYWSCVCAGSEALESAGLVCCNSGDREYVSGIGHICTGRSMWAACRGNNDICSSGVCDMDDLCIVTMRRLVTKECVGINTAQCASGIFARSEALESVGRTVGKACRGD